MDFSFSTFFLVWLHRVINTFRARLIVNNLTTTSRESSLINKQYFSLYLLQGLGPKKFDPDDGPRLNPTFCNGYRIRLVFSITVFDNYDP